MTEPPIARRPAVEPRDAATLVLLRQGSRGLEVLLTRRPSSMAFAADVHVFPGGRVEPDDAVPRLVARSVLTPDEAAERLGGALSPLRALALHVAAIREAHEEVGVLLATPAREQTARTVASGAPIGGGGLTLGAARSDRLADLVERLDLHLRTDLLVPVARWVTPRFMDRRFDTWFFAAALPDGARLDVDPREVVDHAWFRPSGALGAMAHGSIAMWLPTSSVLARLEDARDLDDVRARVASFRAASPLRVDRPAPGVVRFTAGAAAGVPGLVVHAYLVGERNLLLVDPGDPDEAVLDAILAEIAARPGATLRAVVLTSADPDHAGGCEALAGELRLPILGPEGASRRLPFPVTALRDGERLPHGDVPLVARSVRATTGRPGLALVGDALAFVGDALAFVGDTAPEAALDAPARDVAVGGLAPEAPVTGTAPEVTAGGPDAPLPRHAFPAHPPSGWDPGPAPGGRRATARRPTAAPRPVPPPDSSASR